MQTIEDFQLNVRNIKRLRGQSPRAFDAVRFDSNNNCNVRCVYCHNPRSQELVDLDDFRAFLQESVIATDTFQIGCAMEPTLDERLGDFMDIVAKSPGRPRRCFRLQTNGILLDRHDAERMERAGLTHLTVSVDSANDTIHKELRGGTSLRRVERNIREFQDTCPSIDINLITTVTSANIDSLRELVLHGIDLGVRRFVFRQMFYYSQNLIVDHARMPQLIVSQDVFAAFRDCIVNEFRGQVGLSFLDNVTLVHRASRVRSDSQID